MTKEALKFDTNKLSWTILPFIALEHVVKVFMFGQSKYSRGNYRNGFEQHRLIDALLRHTIAHARGEDRDIESGEYHLAHVCCCSLMLLCTILEGKDTDNRKDMIV
jgi:hypothetical protein